MHTLAVASSSCIALWVLVGVTMGCAAQGSPGHDRPYATGVYWLEQGAYVLDVTVHNTPPIDQYPIGQVWVVSRDAFGFEAPEGWFAESTSWGVMWLVEYGLNGIQPGEQLSGFMFRNSVLQDQYEYGLRAGGLKFGNVFTPVPIPEPGLASFLGWGACSIGLVWQRRRTRPRGP